MTTQTYRIAHIREQGQDMVIVPLEGGKFHNRPHEEKMQVRDALQACSEDAGLAGEVCLVWTYGRRFYFIAPEPWHAFFRSLTMVHVRRNLNKKLACTGF